MTLFSSMGSIILNVFLVMLLFGVTIFVHELGHFLTARRLGLVIDTFSIGFGPAVWKKKVKGIVYKIGILPFGGYVALPQLDPGGGAVDAEGNTRDLPDIAAWKKIPVAFAGAFCNVVLAFVIAWGIYLKSDSLSFSETAVVGYVATNAPAYEAGLRAGDRILAIDGSDVSRWDQLIYEAALKDDISVLVRSPAGEERTLLLESEPFPVGGGRYIPGIDKQIPCLIIGVSAGKSADRAGLKARDIVTQFAGQPIYSVPQLIGLVDEYRDQPTSVEVIRDREKLTFDVTPQYDAQLDRALIGIEFNQMDMSKRPVDQMVAWASPVFRLLRALVTPSEARHAAGAIGGPPRILQMIWMAVDTSMLLALWMIGMLNVNLAIINLLPIPILDGGHIVFAFIEVVTRRKLHKKSVEWISTVFAILLISLFVFLSFNDIRKMVTEKSAKSAEVEQNGGTVPSDAQGAAGNNQ
ncbi:MAG: RIP metalloprotease RseP [Spartobacteria bacterium]|nr:RIP metalloprotease RseP [Spartobacteria bacterium]